MDTLPRRCSRVEADAALIRKTPARTSNSTQVCCSGCHGSDARGNGPASPFINVSVPDLTHIAAGRGGAFPADDVYRIIDSHSDLLPHGVRHMPVWGYEFFDADEDEPVAHQQAINKVEQLVRYVHSLQRAD